MDVIKSVMNIFNEYIVINVKNKNTLIIIGEGE